MNFKKYGAMLFATAAIALFTTGCAQKTTIKAIKAAKVSDKDVKQIGVLPFKNDKVGQADQVNSSIDRVEMGGKKYFNLIDRENIKRIMAEKELNDSGLVDLINDDSANSGLSEVKTLVTGNVISNSMSESNYLESRTDYSTCVRYRKTRKGKTYCAQYRKYNVNCKARNYDLKTSVKLIKVANGSTMFSDTYATGMKRTHCVDDNRVLPSKQEAGTELAGDIARKLVKDIAPSYVYFRVTLLEKPDVEYNKVQTGMLKVALKLIAQNRTEKAHTILVKLNKQLNDRSYVALYNLAVTEEALGNVAKAHDLFKKAEDISLATEVVEEISIAIQRTKKNLAELNKAKKQM